MTKPMRPHALTKKMTDFDWKTTLAKVAPGIATALGGPLAGVAVSMATKGLGLVDGDEGALASAVASGDPNILVKLKEIERDFQIELKRMDISMRELEVQDRDSARTLAIKTTVTPQVVLSTVYTVGYFGMVYMLFTGQVEIPVEQADLAKSMIAIMTAAQLQIMNFWFGSSAGSKAKDKK